MITVKAGMKSDPPTVLVTHNPPPPKNKTEKEEPKVNFDIADAMRKILPEYTEEQKKYIQCYNLPEYRKTSYGDDLSDDFLKITSPYKGCTIIDWGCGTGRGGRALYEKGDGLDVTLVDFAFNCLDDDVKELTKDNDRFRFFEHDLNNSSDLQSELGYCVDVMEHIPGEEVDNVLRTILYSSKHVFFQICTKHDLFSKAFPEIGGEDGLHLTVKPYLWWLRKFSDHSVVVHSSTVHNNHVIFYVTGWSKTALTWEGGFVNTDPEKVKENIAANAKLGIQPMIPHSPSEEDIEVMLLCGGPSLNEFEDEIRQHRKNGVKCITVNGAYNWCLERDIKPSLQCIIDARPFMIRMVEQKEGITDETKYMLASQCDPSLFEVVPHDRTYMWQVSMSKDLIPYIKEHFGTMYSDWFPSPGGSTCGLRTLVLLRILGFPKIYVYGMDSCLFKDKNPHAYEQEEDDYLIEKGIIPLIVGEGTKYERSFDCQPWMCFQAREFELMTGPALKDTQLQVKGDGLIAYMIETAAAKYQDELENDK